MLSLFKYAARGALLAKAFIPLSVRLYRQNPYREGPDEVTPAEREAQKEKPVWERRFDLNKYKIQEGPLKVRFLPFYAP